MQEYYAFQYKNTDLNFYHCGIQKCQPKHSFGPALRDHYLIHYILEGKGIYKVGSETYELKKGQGFLICPGVITFYQADDKDPWHYMWVGFHGLKAKEYLENAGLNEKKLTFTYDQDDGVKKLLENMMDANHLKKGKDQNLMGYLYLFLGKLIENNKDDYCERKENQKISYVKEGLKYIQANYWRNITVNEIACQLSLNRSYLYTLFKEQLAVSPQQYIIQFRIEKACELMENTTLTISQISRSVGYEDPLMFSKAFKKVKGISPKKYRNLKH